VQRLLVGCLVLLLLGAVALGLAGYFGYRVLRPLVDQVSTSVDQARELAAMGERLENKSAFTPPANGELTEQQVRRLLAVHDRVRTLLGSRWTEFESMAKALEARASSEGRQATFGEIASVLSELGSLFVEGRRAHIDALNAEKFSGPEYTWVRLRVYEAAGLELARSLDWAALEATIKESAGQAGVEVPPVTLPEIPARNRELVKPHVERLKTWLPLALLGL
jgi:hypothetical protein